MRHLNSGLIGWLVLLAIAGCEAPSTFRAADQSPSPPQLPWFQDVTAEWGLEFTHDPGPIDENYALPQINGSGAALFDFDNDGRLDIYLLQAGGPASGATNALFRQLPSGKFQDVSHGSGLDINGTNQGVAVGDVNNDGWLDVVVTRYRGGKFFLNRGNGTFLDLTDLTSFREEYWGTSASFFDYDRDGWLDLIVVNYLDWDPSKRCPDEVGRGDYCGPQSFQGTISCLYHNLGCDGSENWLGFEDVTNAAGLDAVGRGMGVVCADFSSDGWPDVFVANDQEANHLWINQHDGTFRQMAYSRGVAFNQFGQVQANMGAAYGDIDGNGLPDLFVTHLNLERHGLWLQASPGLFEERARAAGLANSHWHGSGWGTSLSDFDQDGDLDLALVNGHLNRQDLPAQEFWDRYMDRNQVFENEGTGRFRDVSAFNPAFCDVPNVARGLCVGDIDGDGALDLLVTQVGGPARVLRNIAPRQRHWLIVRAIDPALKRDAIGSEIRVVSGKKRWFGLIQPGQGFETSNDIRAHFGLGDTEHLDAIEVLWPCGSRERFLCQAVDCVVKLERGSGERTESKQILPP